MIITVTAVKAQFSGLTSESMIQWVWGWSLECRFLMFPSEAHGPGFGTTHTLDVDNQIDM